MGRSVVAFWLLPGYFAGEQDTAYARLERRFGPGTRQVVSLVFLTTRFLGDGVRIFAGALPLAVLTGWSIPTAIIAMGVVTLVYTWFGGLKAVVWADVVQLTVYVAGGAAALGIAWSLAGGAGPALHTAAAAGKLHLLEFHVNLTSTYTLLGGMVGGAMLSAASHGTDQLIVQRLLATRSLGAARVALIGSGVVVIAQFLLFLLVGSAIWAAGFAPASMRPDDIFPAFIVQHLPHGLAGLLIAGILAAAMSTISSSINALASSMTQDLYARWSGRTDPDHLYRVGRWFSVGWGLALVGGALFFYAIAGGGQTPVVVLALSIASITYGALLGTYILATRWPAARSRDVITAVIVTVAVMLLVVFAARLDTLPGFGWLSPIAKLAWPWDVPLGTCIAVATGVISSSMRRTEGSTA